MLVLKVMFLIEMGMLLVIMPWTAIWTENSLIAGSLRLHAIVNHGFLRGAVSGLGLVNLWIGVWEAVQYRED